MKITNDMKSTIYIFVLSFLSSINFSYSQDTTKIQGGVFFEELVYETFLFGKVKSIKTSDSTEQYYNQNGKLTSEIVQYNNLCQFIYDSRGNVIQEISYDGKNSDDEIIGLHSYIYDTNNKLILEVNDAVRWGGQEKYTYEYDNKGNLIKKNWYYKGSLRESIAFDYNDKHQLISESIFDDSNKLTQKTIYKYNNNGDVVDVSSFDSNNDLKQRYTYEYDERHNKLKETRYQAFQSYSFEYDEFCHLIKIVQDNPGYERVYKLKLDAHNNWIEKKEFVNGKLSEVKTRAISYY